MRITKVSVKKLFGIFDHEIPLNQESRITIIHGPNGFGKTILLTMLNGLFNASYRVFREVSFEEFRVYFDHQVFLNLREDNDELILSFTSVTGTHSAVLHEDSEDGVGWLNDIKRSENVELIKTQRLQTEVAIESESYASDSRTRNINLAVEESAAKTAHLVHNVHEERNLSKSQWEEINGILKKLRNVIVHQVEDELEGPIDAEIQNKLNYVEAELKVILRRESSIEARDRRLTMLVELLNGHFDFKRIYTDAENGLIIVADNNHLIPVASLSSGEQHLLVLYSKLLFDIPPKSLVLIDEPELSLHVTWQHEFINDLKRIIDLCDFDVLLATHSPQIVNDKIDWMVDLHNPEADYSDDVAEYA